MNLCVENEAEAVFDFDIVKVAEAVCNQALTEEKCEYGIEINLLITDDEGIREMNRDNRDIDAVTDVLSFPNVTYTTPGDFSVMSGSQYNDCYDPDTAKIMLGDIVINCNRVREQAQSYGHSEKREFAFLVAHSMLHLCGYDHMEKNEAAVMEKKQNDILSSLGITRDN